MVLDKKQRFLKVVNPVHVRFDSKYFFAVFQSQFSGLLSLPIGTSLHYPAASNQIKAPRTLVIIAGGAAKDFISLKCAKRNYFSFSFA